MRWMCHLIDHHFHLKLLSNGLELYFQTGDNNPPILSSERYWQAFLKSLYLWTYTMPKSCELSHFMFLVYS